MKETTQTMNINNRKTYLDLEEDLNAIAHSIEDLNLVYQATDDEDIDQIQNMLLGLTEMFNIKIANAFDTLEDILASERETKINRVDPENRLMDPFFGYYYRQSLFDPRN